MTTGRIDYAPDYKSFDVKPPAAGIVRFCPRCGRNDRVGVLGDHHFAGGVRCGGIPVELQYALADPERSRLERAVVEAARYWRRVQGEALHVTEVDGMRPVVVRAWFALRKSVDALIEFESKETKD